MHALADRAEDCRPLAGALIARAAVRPLDLDSAELVRGLLDAGLLDAASSTMAPIPGVPEALARWSVTVTETPAVWCSMLPLTVGENWVRWTCGSGSGLVVVVVA